VELRRWRTTGCGLMVASRGRKVGEAIHSEKNFTMVMIKDLRLVLGIYSTARMGFLNPFTEIIGVGVSDLKGLAFRP